MKRNSKRKCISMAMVAAMSISLALTGCGQKQNDTNAATSTPTATNEATVQQAAQLDPVEISWYVVNTPQKDTDAVVAEVNKMLKEKTNLNTTLNYVVLDWGSYNDKLNVMLQAGEPIDICFTAPWINYYLPQVSKGAFQPLDELLDKYGQDIKAQVPGKYLDGVRVKGKIYGVPNYQGYAQPKGFTFRKDLVDKYKFDYKSVKSIYDLEPYLETIKKNEPGVTPYMPAGNNNTDAYLTKNHDGITGYMKYDVKANKFVNTFDIPEIVEGYKLLRSWYQKGYIAKDAATRKDANAETKSGKYAVMELSTYFNDGIKTTKDYQYPTYDVAVAPASMLTTNMISVAMNAITKNSEHPDRAMMLMNAMWANKDIYNTLGFGLEEKHWKWIDDAKTTIDTIPGAGYDSPILWELGSAFNKYYTKEETKEFLDPQLQNNESTPPSPLLGFNWDAEKLKNETAQLDALFVENMPLLYTGSVDTDKFVTTIKEKMNKVGIDKVLADAEAQVAEWKKVSGK